jgi:hypothetical protein
MKVAQLSLAVVLSVKSSTSCCLLTN